MSSQPIKPCFVGIVPALPHTAAVVLAPGENAPTARHFCGHGRLDDADIRRVVQHREVANMIIAAIHAAGEPELVALLAADGAATRQVELAAHLRHRIYNQGWPLVEIPRTLATAFIAGRGALDEEALRPLIAAVYGHRCRRPWEALAYALAHAARCLSRPGAYPAYQVQKLAAVRFKILDPAAEAALPSCYPAQVRP